jgi:hypothetical protein
MSILSNGIRLVFLVRFSQSDWMGLFEAVEWANEEQSRQQQKDAVFFSRAIVRDHT